MYKNQILNFGFIILNPDKNPVSLKGTMRSIRNHYDSPCLCVVPKDTNKKELDAINALCLTVKGGESYTSLINTGIKKSRVEWKAGFPDGTRSNSNRGCVL